MGIRVSELQKYVIFPVLQSMNMYSLAAERLLLGTAAQESGMGEWLRQTKNGPARGIYQIELATLSDLYDRYLRFNWTMMQKVEKWRVEGCMREIDVIGNLYYATAVCRMQYYRHPQALPDENDLEGMAICYKRYWNGPGKATPISFMERYKKYVAPMYEE